MESTRWLERLAYVVLIALAGVFWIAANGIEFAERPGTLGPDFWPKLALALIIIVSLYEIGRSFLSRPDSEVGGLTADFDTEEDDDDAPRRPGLLASGMLLTVAYGALIPFLGFVVATFAFLVLFAYVGRYRNHLAIWLAALIGTSVFALLFLRVVYVSLPRGIPPFDKVTDFFVGLF